MSAAAPATQAGIVLTDERPTSRGPAPAHPEGAPVADESTIELSERDKSKKPWRRYGVLDFLIGLATLYTIVWIWGYILKNL